RCKAKVAFVVKPGRGPEINFEVQHRSSSPMCTVIWPNWPGRHRRSIRPRCLRPPQHPQSALTMPWPSPFARVRSILGPCHHARGVEIGHRLRCYEPRGALSCGSPMPRGERIAKPAEWEHPRGRSFFVLECAGWNQHGGNTTMRTMLTKSSLFARLVIAAIVAACSSSERATAPRIRPAFAISDAVHEGGTPG